MVPLEVDFTANSEYIFVSTHDSSCACVRLTTISSIHEKWSESERFLSLTSHTHTRSARTNKQTHAVRTHAHATDESTPHVVYFHSHVAWHSIA